MQTSRQAARVTSPWCVDVRVFSGTSASSCCGFARTTPGSGSSTAIWTTTSRRAWASLSTFGRCATRSPDTRHFNTLAYLPGGTGSVVLPSQRAALATVLRHSITSKCCKSSKLCAMGAALVSLRACMLLIRGSVSAAFARQTNPGANGEYGLGAPPADMPMCGQGGSWGEA
eukprot:COSAG02_NODE_19566_length_876_cov_0.786358_1_plen_171_part_10